MIARIFHNPNIFNPVDSFDVANLVGKRYPQLILTHEFCEGLDGNNDVAILEWIFRIHNAVDGTERVVKLGLRSLSVGDEVELDGRRYLCAGRGWERING